MEERKDDYLERRGHLKNMSDQDLKGYFLKLSDEIVEPLLELAYKNTTKSIERSVLLRMGLSSIQAKAVTEVLNEHRLLSKGAGQCVYLLAKHRNLSIKDAGQLLMNNQGIEFLKGEFEKNETH